MVASDSTLAYLATSLPWHDSRVPFCLKSELSPKVAIEYGEMWPQKARSRLHDGLVELGDVGSLRFAS